MDEAKQRRLIESGWRIGGATDFLGLSVEELLEIERREETMADNIFPINANILPQGYARLNITFNRTNGDLPDPVLIDSTDEQLRRYASEAVQGGSVPGIPASPNADFRDYKIDRYDPTDDVPVYRIMLRPKTEFGSF